GPPARRGKCGACVRGLSRGGARDGLSVRRSSQPLAGNICPLYGASNVVEIDVGTEQDRGVQHDGAVMGALRVEQPSAGSKAARSAADVRSAEARVKCDSLGANCGAEALAVEAEGLDVELVADFVERRRRFAVVREATQPRHIGEKLIEPSDCGGAAGVSLV